MKVDKIDNFIHDATDEGNTEVKIVVKQLLYNFIQPFKVMLLFFSYFCSLDFVV